MDSSYEKEEIKAVNTVTKINNSLWIVHSFFLYYSRIRNIRESKKHIDNPRLGELD